MISREEIDNMISYHERIEQEIKDDLESGVIVPEQIPESYSDLGGQEQSLGLYYAYLGEFERSCSHFREATEYFMKSLELPDDFPDTELDQYRQHKPIKLINALHTAVLSGENIKEVVSRCEEELDKEYVENYPYTASWYYYLKSLVSVVNGDLEQAYEFSQKLGEASDLSSREKNLPVFIEGLYKEDLELVEEGIRGQLSSHEQEMSDPPLTEDLICVPASVFYRLAKRSSYEPDIDSPYLFDADCDVS